jgi:hypothetical protein
MSPPLLRVRGASVLHSIQSLDVAAGLALARILLAVERSLAALNMAGGALLDLLHIGARALYAVFAVGTHHRCSLRAGRNEKQRASTGEISAWVRSDERSTADAADTEDGRHISTLHEGAAMMTTDVIPRPALLLRWAGVIPFALLTAASLLNIHPWSLDPTMTLRAYGACILSFMGGAQWGV